MKKNFAIALMVIGSFFFMMGLFSTQTLEAPRRWWEILICRPPKTAEVSCTNPSLLLLGLLFVGIGLFLLYRKPVGDEEKISEVAEVSADKKNSSES